MVMGWLLGVCVNVYECRRRGSSDCLPGAMRPMCLKCALARQVAPQIIAPVWLAGCATASSRRCPQRHHAAATGATSGPVASMEASRRFYDIQVVFDDDGCCPRRAVACNAETQLMSAKCSPVVGSSRIAGAYARCRVAGLLRQLHALRLTALKRGGAAPGAGKLRPTSTAFAACAQWRVRLGRRPGVFLRQLQHLHNVAALPLHLRRFAVVALAVARRRARTHRAKVHFTFTTPSPGRLRSARQAR